jgi:hypothetical protein
MSVQSSNLSGRGYDLVCAVPQDVINKQMTPYVLKLKVPEFSACYFGASDGLTAMSVAEVKASFGGDPFTDGGDRGFLEALAKQDFQFAFKATPGLPKGLPLAKLPALIELDQGPSSIRHQLYFAELEVVWLRQFVYRNRFAKQERWRIWLESFVQDAADPVIISSRVDLGVGDADPGALPAGLPGSLATLYPGTVFSIKQLFLDVATSNVVGCSPLGGANDPHIPACIVSEYWKNVPAKAKVLGYGVTAPAASLSPTITPTALGFVVSPHLDAKGTPDGKTGLNTLNYLVMADNRALPAVASFPWNWVDTKEDESSFDAVMAVRSGLILDFLCKLLNGGAAPLSIEPGIEEDGTATFATSAAPSQWRAWASGDPVDFEWWDFFDDAPPPPPLLVIEFEKYTDGSAKVVDELEAKWGIDYAMKGWVKRATGSNLEVIVNVVAHAHLTRRRFQRVKQASGWGEQQLVEDKIDLKIVDYQQSATYMLGLSEHGQLTATMATPPPLVDNSETPQANWPFGAFVIAMQQQMQSVIKTAVTGVESQIETLLDGPTSWVFPGADTGQTFVLEDLVFSDSDDVVVHASYAAARKSH